jgi:hypothetical protein
MVHFLFEKVSCVLANQLIYLFERMYSSKTNMAPASALINIQGTPQIKAFLRHVSQGGL